MNVVIVESKNDRVFFEKVLSQIQETNISLVIEPASIEIRDLENGLSEETLKVKIKDILLDIPKKGIKKIGVLIDKDAEEVSNRIKLVNKAFETAFSEISSSQNIKLAPIQDINTLTLQKIENYTFEIACYFTNVSGQGELEDLLKALANQTTDYADCLEVWKTCLENKGKEISSKDFTKLWVNFYIRWDTCTKKDMAQAGKKCVLDYAIQNKDIFDYSSPHLEDVKRFFKLFIS